MLYIGSADANEIARVRRVIGERGLSSHMNDTKWRELCMAVDFEQGAVFSYHCDFGDNWRHTAVVKEFLTLASTPKNGRCVAGARARPPEDVGGVSGYERFLEIISDREDPEYAETIR